MPRRLAANSEPEEILLARVDAAQPLAVDDGPADVDAAGVMLRQRRDEAAVHRGEDRQVRRAVRRLRRLVVGLDHRRRQPFRNCQLRLSHWHKPSARARERARPSRPDSRMACASPISAGTPKRS